MKRIFKNVISFLIIALMICAMLLTSHFLQPVSTQPQMQPMAQQMSPEKPDVDDSTSAEAPPEKPDNQDAASAEAPPEKPDDQDATSAEAPPEKPDGEASSMEKPDDTENPAPADMAQPASDNAMLYYILIAAESLIAAMMILYLIMSVFHRKGFRETFINRDKVIIYVLAIVILTAVIAFANVKLLDSSVSEPMQSDTVSYSATKEITEDTSLSDEEFSSEKADENVVLATGDISASLTDVSITKSGDSDGGDNSNFYGNNSAILAKSNAKLALKGLEITTNADGANGVFSYGGSATTQNSSGDGTEITIQDSKITTSGDNAGGIMTTGGGITNASNLTINTSGTSSAAIRSDRGGGTVNVDGGTYTTTGTGSPAIYSTSQTTVKNAKLIAKASEGAVIEGANSIALEKCTLTDNNTKLNGLSTTYKNVFLYQSMSGDADTGTAEFSAKNSKLTTKKGDSFYVTNTSASILLSGNTIINTDSAGNFLRVQADSWGTEGSNGGDVDLTFDNQKASGNIVIDSISTLKMTLKSKSHFEGVINEENEAKSISLVLDADSTLKLTGDCYVSSLNDDDSTYSNIDFNGYKLYVNGKALN